MPMEIRPELEIPDPVLERLADVDPEAVGLVSRSRGDQVEVRRRPIENRADDPEAETYSVDGFATVYEVSYDVAGGPPYGWTETMARGAFRKTLDEQEENVAFLFDHEGIPLARVASGTLELADEDEGLRVAATMSRRSPHSLSVIEAIDREDVDEMSLAFRAMRQEWNDNYTERRVLEARLYDVSGVTSGANGATVIQGRKASDEARSDGRISTVLARAYAERAHLSAT